MLRHFPNRGSRLGPDVRWAVCNACNVEGSSFLRWHASGVSSNPWAIHMTSTGKFGKQRNRRLSHGGEMHRDWRLESG